MGERPVGVDQTNESVIVGDAAVVKWATHLQDGPHPAPRRIGMLREAGFGGMPAPWGLVTWTAPADGAETLVANVDDYLPGRGGRLDVGGRPDHRGRSDRDAGAVHRGGGRRRHVVAELHAALSGTAAVAIAREAEPVARRRARNPRNRLRPRAIPTSVAVRTGSPRRDRGHPRRSRRAGRHPGHRGARRPARRPGAAQPAAGSS